ncbi:MAG: hypothetical protein ONB13_08405 [candidate division KSB1 bacterium]|nr:hypothetical protein [candidate division KSB1 bacterium]
MQKGQLSLLLSAALMILLACGTTQKLVFQEPEAGKSLLVGAVLVENDGIDDLYESKTANITVVIVSKFSQEGKEESKGYRIKTDKDGYFMIPNIQPGSFVLKGIEVDLGFNERYIISSMWEGNRQIFFTGANMIDYNVRIWPPENNEKVINLGINYFKIDNAGRILYDNFKSLNNNVLGLKDKRHTMPSPVNYYLTKYPESKWFQ